MYDKHYRIVFLVAYLGNTIIVFSCVYLCVNVSVFHIITQEDFMLKI